MESLSIRIISLAKIEPLKARLFPKSSSMQNDSGNGPKSSNEMQSGVTQTSNALIVLNDVDQMKDNTTSAPVAPIIESNSTSCLSETSFNGTFKGAECIDLTAETLVDSFACPKDMADIDISSKSNLPQLTDPPGRMKRRLAHTTLMRLRYPIAKQSNPSGVCECGQDQVPHDEGMVFPLL
jgi:hypothetical protein